MIDQKVLQNLHELLGAYAKISGLSILIIDENGKKLLPTMLGKSLKPLFGELDSIETFYLDIIKKTATEEFTFIYNIAIDKVKIIISPLHTQTGEKYFILAGPIVEEDTKDALLNNIMSSSLPSELKQSLTYNISLSKELTPAEVNEKMSIISSLSQNVRYMLNIQLNIGWIKDNLTAIIDQGCSPEIPSLEQLIKDFHDHTEVLDTICYAEKSSNDDYIVTYAFGDYASHLKGITFRHGEGFLGLASVSDGPKDWSSIERDPRSALFIDLDMPIPENLWCNSIQLYGHTTGIIFTLDFNKSKLVAVQNYIRNMIVSILTSRMNLVIMSESYLKQKQRLAGLVEIAGFIKSSENMQKIMYALVDSCITLFPKPISALMYIAQDVQRTKVKIVSRGYSKDKQKQYVQESSKILFTTSVKKANKPIVSVREQGKIYQYDFPLVIHNELYGALTLSCHHSADMEECLGLMSTLVTIASMHIEKMCEKGESGNVADELSNMLFKSLKEQNMSTYEHLKTLEMHVSSVLTSNPHLAGDHELIKRAIRLSSFSAEFLKSSPYLAKEAFLLEQCKQMEKQEAVPEDSAMELLFMFVALQYDTQKMALKTNLLNKVGLNEGKIESIKELLEEQGVLEAELQLGAETEKVQNRTLIEDIVKQYGLTAREKDIFQGILHASSNKEIAKNLYISEHTVKNHITNLFNKLGVTERAQAIALVLNSSLNNEKS
ncbi:response regulator transcription factor [Cytobacillus gottheilii]|uniref:response regulator transcription factor n=1 Tax=Cytobacillus gottheilii TaxID=859144 RepID=UPI0009BAB004|nr:helix-turn-helix transcriptional regulator [Cytobacillus gottheilii]